MNSKSNKPEKVYNWLRSYIDENKFSANKKLPSEHVICMKFNVSRETVRAAEQKLLEERLIYKVQGSGTYINKEEALEQGMKNSSASVKIGLILQGQDTNANENLINGIKSALKDYKADLSLFFTDNKFSNERRCLQNVIHQDFNGFIVDAVKASILNPNLDCYRDLYNKKIPIIFYNNYYKELRYPKVINNDWKCALGLIGQLADAGHKHIAGIFVYDNYQSIEKFKGYVTALRKHGLEFDDDNVKWRISNEAHSSGFYKEIVKFLKSRPKCTAVVCCNYMILQAVLDAVKYMGKKIPDDYSVVCFDYSKADWEETGIACSIHPGYKMGTELGERIIRMINDKRIDDIDYTYVFEPQLYTGRSVKHIAALSSN